MVAFVVSVDAHTFLLERSHAPKSLELVAAINLHPSLLFSSLFPLLPHTPTPCDASGISRTIAPQDQC